MANIYTTVTNMTNAKLKEVSDNKKAKEDKEKTKGSNYIEPTIAMIEDVRVRWIAGQPINKIKFGVRTTSGQKMTFEQVKEIILVLENVSVYNTDKNRYELRDDGKTLIDKNA
jgi:hypothetical protein